MFSPRGTRAGVATATLAALAFFQPISASANCETLMSNLNTFLSTQPHGPGTYEVLVRMTALRSDGGYAAYAEGSSTSTATGYQGVLTYHAGGRNVLPTPAFISDPATPGTARGLTTYFSDRRYATSTCTLCLGVPEYPFSSNAADREGVFVQLQDSFSPFTHTTIPAGAVTFTLYSWGNATVSMVNNECTVNGTGTGGILFGFVPDPGGRELIALSLNGSYTPPVATPKLVPHR